MKFEDVSFIILLFSTEKSSKMSSIQHLNAISLVECLVNNYRTDLLFLRKKYSQFILRYFVGLHLFPF